jgi:hypothetical protein
LSFSFDSDLHKANVSIDQMKKNQKDIEKIAKGREVNLAKTVKFALPLVN